MKTVYNRSNDPSRHYPFGMLMPGRSFSIEDYRFGFNGKENDNEVKGDGNQQDYGMRIYDARIGKFLSADPLIVQKQLYAELSPYQFAANCPIEFLDLDGLEPLKPNNSRVSGSAKLTIGKVGGSITLAGFPLDILFTDGAAEIELKFYFDVDQFSKGITDVGVSFIRREVVSSTGLGSGPISGENSSLREQVNWLSFEDGYNTSKEDKYKTTQSGSYGPFKTDGETNTFTAFDFEAGIGVVGLGVNLQLEESSKSRTNYVELLKPDETKSSTPSPPAVNSSSASTPTTKK